MPSAIATPAARTAAESISFFMLYLSSVPASSGRASGHLPVVMPSDYTFPKFDADIILFFGGESQGGK